MKLPKQQLDELTEGLLKMLRPAEEPGTQIMQISGTQLTSNGVTKDINLKPIIGGKKYLYPAETMVPVDHKLKIAQIIDEAADISEMQQGLAAYLVKYAKENSEIFKPNK